jgi:hypothetical protein
MSPRSEAAVHVAGRLELLRCYYNFIRLHRGSRFGRELKALAMQAGFAPRNLSLREVFEGTAGVLLCVQIVLDFRVHTSGLEGCQQAA